MQITDMNDNYIITDSEIRCITIEILEDVVSFCDKNNLIYYLTYGTLIGAIRHKGFIPWDDDVDIMMPRPDYEKFISSYRSKYYSVSNPLDSGSFIEWAKVYDNRTIKIERDIDYNICKLTGVDIDIFPIDGQPDETFISEFIKDSDYRIKLHKYIVRATRNNDSSSLKKKIASLPYRIIGAGHYIKKYIRNASKYSYNTSLYVGIADPYPWAPYCGRHKKTLFESKVKVEFEGKLYWAPAGYDEFLKQIYGNYMILPPIEKQVAHHNYKVCWK